MPGLQPLPRVYTYRDDGPILGNRTRWKPRRVCCTTRQDHTDLPGIDYVVKYRQGTIGTTALISEVVCGTLFQVAGVEVPDAAMVSVSPRLSASYRNQPDVSFPVEPGLHFGAKRLRGVHPGPPTQLDELANPQELVDIWVLDSWVMNTDRGNHGNMLMRPGSKGRWHLIAVDQSDCFGGSGRMADGSSSFAAAAPAESCPLLPGAIWLAGGKRAVRKSIDAVRRAVKYVRAAMERVPEEWWEEAHLDSHVLQNGLARRSQCMEDIVRVREWEEGIDDVLEGRRPLDL